MQVLCLKGKANINAPFLQKQKNQKKIEEGEGVLGGGGGLKKK